MTIGRSGEGVTGKSWDITCSHHGEGDYLAEGCGLDTSLLLTRPEGDGPRDGSPAWIATRPLGRKTRDALDLV